MKLRARGTEAHERRKFPATDGPVHSCDAQEVAVARNANEPDLPMPDVGLCTATEPLFRDMKVGIKYSVAVNRLAEHWESYDVEKLAGELQDDEAKAVEIWS